MLKKYSLAVLLLFVALLFCECKEVKQEETEQTPSVATGEVSIPARNPKWAVPIEGKECSNLHKVSDDLYRGAQPTEECLKELKKMGIKTVVNLRSFHSDRDEIGETGLAYEHIYMKAWNAEDEEIVRFLQIVNDPARTPVFVHCQHGADRTGTMSAIYRNAMQGWTKDEAMKELTEGGFGWHAVWNETLLPYLRDLDIEAIKKRAGMEQQPETQP